MEVHSQLFSEESQGSTDNRRREGVQRIHLWVHRGHCPHLVEATGHLVACQLEDEEYKGRRDDDYGNSGTRRGESIALSLAYAAAFSRFVTGLLDSHQESRWKQSMFDVARLVGLPESLVELRHQITHEQLPSLPKLRRGADQALAWIRNQYWHDFPERCYSGERAPNPIATAPIMKTAARVKEQGWIITDEENGNGEIPMHELVLERTRGSSLFKRKREDEDEDDDANKKSSSRRRDSGRDSSESLDLQGKDFSIARKEIETPFQKTETAIMREQEYERVDIEMGDNNNDRHHKVSTVSLALVPLPTREDDFGEPNRGMAATLPADALKVTTSVYAVPNSPDRKKRVLIPPQGLDIGFWLG